MLFLLGCLLMFTTLSLSSDATLTSLPTDFIRTCRTISLSNIALTPSNATLTKLLWMNKNSNDANNFYSLLLLCFASLPPSITAQCDTLPDTLRPLLFNLGILHTAVVVTNSKSSQTLINFERAHLSLFTRCIEEVLALALARHDGGTSTNTTHTPRGDPVVILKTTTAHVRHVYGQCLPQCELEELIGACLSEEATKPSGRVKLERLGGMEVSVPSLTVTVRMFQDHVKGVMGAAEQASNQQLIRYV